MEEPKSNKPDPGQVLENGYDLVSIKERTTLFIKYHWRGLVAVLTPLLIIPILLPFPPKRYSWCAYTLILMAVFWVSECIALPVTSFLPVFIFPLTNVLNSEITCEAYFNDTVVMFIGSLFLASSVEQSGLHIRLALCAIRCIGYSHLKLLFAICFVTMFASMWITNTAATTMMVPMIFAVLGVFEEQKLLNLYEKNADGEPFASDMTTAYFCAVTFSATIGGIGTLVGTGTNLVFRGLFATEYPTAPEYLSFPKFSAFAIPYMIVMELWTYFCMVFVYFGFLRPNSAAAKTSLVTEAGLKAAKASVGKQWEAIGKIKFWEIMCLILFGGAMISFFCRSPQIFKGWGDVVTKSHNYDTSMWKVALIQDSCCAMFVSFLMFWLPSSLKILENFKAKYVEQFPKGPVSSVVDYKTMNAVMPWSFCFLLGGGFALSTAAGKKHANLNDIIGGFLQKLSALPNFAIIFLIIVFTVFLTNFASNVAVANVVTPIAMNLAIQIKQNPLWYNIASGYAASYCFCLPVGTPGNLIVQSAAKIPTGKMIVAGAAPTVGNIIISWFMICFWAPVIWPDLTTKPTWLEATP